MSPLEKQFVNEEYGEGISSDFSIVSQITPSQLGDGLWYPVEDVFNFLVRTKGQRNVDLKKKNP